MRNLKSHLHIAILLTVCLAVFLIKCKIAYPVKYVGHADASGYAEMADSLIHGRGFEVDYISWYFIKYDRKIIRPEDHWPPLYSIAIAPFFLVLGKTAFAAKLPSLIISCFLFPLVLYSLARELSGSKFAGLAAGLSVLLYPFIFRWSLHCLSDVLYGFVVCAGVLYAVKALDNDKFFYPLGIFMGLAYYAKGSGLVTIPGYVLFYVIARRSIKKVFTDRKFLTSLLIAFLILLPWMIRNYIHFRDPLFSTQRFSAGYVGYEDWEEGTYELYWGEKPPPSYFDKFRESLLFSVKPEFQTDLDNGSISADLREEFKNNNISLSKDARVSVKKTDSRWLIKDNQIYTVRKKGDELNIYEGGIPHVVKMTIEYLKRYFWWVFMDLRSGWGKFSSEAFLTYFTNAPAILGIFLLWGNRKRHAVWIISGLLILFLSIGWSPIDRLALPMVALMMALGWATYFVVIKTILILLSKIPMRRLAVESRNLFGTGNLERKRQEALAFARRGISFAKTGGGIRMLAGVITFCLVMPVVMRSAESVNTAIEKSGYPYREGAQEWMDMGKWLRENAPPDSITMTRNPWELHFYSEQLAIQIPRANLQKTIEVMRFYRPNYIIPQLDIRPSLKQLVEGEVPGLELVYDNKKIQLYRIDYSLLPSGL
jgi:4-amino-4-deoxy-L-arabinose transferase-like glycosyltransferase